MIADHQKSIRPLLGQALSEDRRVAIERFYATYLGFDIRAMDHVVFQPGMDIDKIMIANSSMPPSGSREITARKPVGIHRVKSRAYPDAPVNITNRDDRSRHTIFFGETRPYDGFAFSP